MNYPFKKLNKKKYILCFINALIENIFLYSMPLILAYYLTLPFTLNKFKKLIIAIICVKLGEIVLNSIWNTIVRKFLVYNKKELQIAYFKRICNMNISKINDIHTGYLKKQLDTIIEESFSLFNELMMTINGFIVAVSIFLIQVYRQNIIVFIICLCFILLIVIYNVLITKFNVKSQEKYNDEYAKYNATSVDFLQNIKIVKSFDSLDYAVKVMNKKFESTKKTFGNICLFGTLRYDGINLFVTIMYIMILLSLYIKMKDGEDIFSYIVFYSSIFSSLCVELRGVASLFTHINKYKSANNQIEKMIVEEEEVNKIRNFNNITLKDIEFKYNKKSDNIISIPYFSLDNKDKISIVGESGQGKSTFLSLFCRYYEIDDNLYLTDNTKTHKIPDVAYITQDSDLFDLSIKDNLCLGKKISKDKLNTYLEEAGLKKWVDSLEEGLDTIVGEKGVKLSVGQKQRINILRGILLDKNIYIFDEPTSNLDTDTEIKITNMINKYLKDKTCIIVTHRPKLKDICNKHYIFKNKTLLKEDL